MALVSLPTRFEIFLVDLDPTQGVEMKKTRPCTVVSPDEMHRHVRTVIIAPMTTGSRTYPTRIRVRFENKDGHVALDQIRAVDASRLVKRLGALDEDTARQVSDALVQMFSW